MSSTSDESDRSMASSHALWKDYFDNPTLSDLTIRLSDRVVHVHRIVLCCGSEYFEKLLTGNFKESEAKEIELRDDDPMAAVGVLRYIYGLGHDMSHVSAMGERQYLAATFVTATKYQLNGLETKIHDEMKEIVTGEKLRSQDTGSVEDFLNAVETVIAGSTRQNRPMRTLMIDCCFWNIPVLTDNVAKFSDLLANNGALGIDIMTRLKSMPSPFEGSWYTGAEWHPNAKPSCIACGEPFSLKFMLPRLSDDIWDCPNCGLKSISMMCTNECCIDSECTSFIHWVSEAKDLFLLPMFLVFVCSAIHITLTTRVQQRRKRSRVDKRY